MTDKEKLAIEILNTKIFNYKLNKKMGIVDKMTKEGRAESDAIETVLNLIEKQQAERKELQMTLARYIAQTLNTDIKQIHKHNEDLEMLYKGCQIELEKKEKAMNKMAKIISGYDIDFTDICNKRIVRQCNDDEKCIECIKKYFENKVSKAI